MDYKIDFINETTKILKKYFYLNTIEIKEPYISKFNVDILVYEINLIIYDNELIHIEFRHNILNNKMYLNIYTYDDYSNYNLEYYESFKSNNIKIFNNLILPNLEYIIKKISISIGQLN